MGASLYRGGVRVPRERRRFARIAAEGPGMTPTRDVSSATVFGVGRPISARKKCGAHAYGGRAATSGHNNFRHHVTLASLEHRRHGQPAKPVAPKPLTQH